MAYVAPPDYGHPGRDVSDSPHGRGDPLDSPQIENYRRRALEPPRIRSPLAPDYAYGSPPGIGLADPNHLGFDMALPERLARLDFQAHPTRFWPTPPCTKDLIVHVIEEAETVLRNQASALLHKEQENEHLLSILRVKEWELQNARMEQTIGARVVERQNHEDRHPGQNSQQPGPSSLPDKHGQLQGVDHGTASRDLWRGNDLPVDSQSSIVIHPNVRLHPESSTGHPSNGLQGQPYTSTRGANAALRQFTLTEGATFSQISSPSSSSMSPIRSRREVESETRTQLGGQGLMQYLGEVPASNGPWQQELYRTQENVKELRKLLSDAAIKEMQLVQEKSMLEKRLSDLHLTIDQYQRELLDAASLRQDVLQESVRLSSELKAVKKDADLYASSLFPLLTEFNLQPAAADAFSIISAVKALVQYLCERNNTSEGKPKESPRSHEPWRTSLMYQSPQRFASPSPIHPLHEVHNRDIAHPPAYSHERPISPTSPYNRVGSDWELQGVPSQHANGFDYYSDSGSDQVRPFPYARQVVEPQGGVSSRRVPITNHGISLDETIDGFTNSEESGSNIGQSLRPAQERAESAIRTQLPTLDEEPKSSASEDDDPLPAIEGLCINGKTVLGNEIGASGVSINGTSLCHFQWVRYYPDGKFKYIPGAAQPFYTITADDVDTMIVLECTPMDDRNRKGEMIRVFANDHNRITLEASMENQITDYIAAGHAIFDVKFVEGSSPDSGLESGILTLKRSQYELKRSSTKKLVISKRYTTESMEIRILNTVHAQCMIANSHGTYCILELKDGWTRDLVVLTMREFIKGAFERKRAKKKLWISKK